jgi:hypothetical protein
LEELFAVIQPAVENHDLSAGSDQGLRLGQGLGRHAEELAGQPDRTLEPAAVAVRPPVRQRRAHERDQARIDGPSVQVPQADDPTHRATPSAGATARANAAKRS